MTTLQPRSHFLTATREALHAGAGFAAAKLGISEIQRLNYTILAERTPPSSPLLKAVWPNMVYHSLQQSALFPPDPAFYLRFNEFYVHHLRNLDCLGVFPDLLDRTRPLIQHFGLTMPLIDFVDLEPDRSSPNDEDNCYLPSLQGKRLLLVSSYAEFLRVRATPEIFQGVWAKTGKPWFNPAHVDAIEFPFGYTSATHRSYSSSLTLFDEIADEMSRRDFDVTLIAAAGLGVPLAAHAKRLGKVGIHLGGHLQVLFGVNGKRWRQWPDWQERYVNECWVDLPDCYRLPETDIADFGAYW